MSSAGFLLHWCASAPLPPLVRYSKVQVVRLYDPARQPADWTAIIRPGQFAAFAKDVATAAPCDAEGRPFYGENAASCLIFDSIEEARAFCEAAVERQPALRFDVFDADGRVQPPLLTITHRDCASGLDTSPAQMGKRRRIAWWLLCAGLPLLIYGYVEFGNRQRDITLPVFLGINMVLVAGRLFWMNLAVRETERVREERLMRASRKIGADDR